MEELRSAFKNYFNFKGTATKKSSNQFFEQKLVENFTCVYINYMHMSHDEAKKNAIDLLEYAKNAAKGYGTLDLPENLGDMIANKVVPQNHEVAKTIYFKTLNRFPRLKIEGVKYKDIQWWWNLKSIERLMIMKNDENVKFAAFITNSQELSAPTDKDIFDLAMNKVNKTFAKYGYDSTTDFTQDDPLPFELKDRVDIYMEKLATNGDLYSLKNKMQNYSSFNAFVRSEIKAGNI